jgi:peptidoglycan/xylan/chitin deacetylase (PgdA/CDA1 family)
MLRMPLRPVSAGGAILCFHSVTTPALPADGTAHVSVDAFKSSVGVARRLGELVPLSELVHRHAHGQSTAGLIAVTLDDAYAALRSELTDFICRQSIPVALFVCTGAAAAGATYWWDRVDDLFPRVALDRWRAFERACGLPEEYRRGQPREYGPLRPLRQWVLAAYAGRWPDHLEPALASLEAEVGYRTRHRSMTFDELASLAAIPGVEIGVHTASHPVLPLLSDADLRHEIVSSYDTLRDRYARVLPILAVPFGLYDERTVRAARSAGMTTSLTLGGALNGHSPDGALPRLCLVRGVTPVRLGLNLLGIPKIVRRFSERPLPLYPDLPSPTT